MAKCIEEHFLLILCSNGHTQIVSYASYKILIIE